MRTDAETIELLQCISRNRDWINEHLEELARDYKGKYIAVYNERVVASAEDIDTINFADEVTTQYFPAKPIMWIL